MSEFENDVSLDINNLHEEWRKQASLYYKWGSKSAKAIKEKFLVEENLKVVKAEARRAVDEMRANLDSHIRDNWENLGFDKKPTEAAITGWITKHDQFKDENKMQDKKIGEVVEKLAQAIENEEKMKVAVLAMSHKKAAIEGEVSLWINEYYSDPKIPKSLKEIDQKEAQNKMREKLNRKK